MENQGKQQRPSVRLTTITGAQPVTQWQLYKGLLYLSLQSFGNQHTQIQQFSQKIVRNYRWLSISQITQIQNLCWALPGPALYQIVITLATLKLQSPAAGVLAFIIFNIPSWIVLLILGQLSSYYVHDDNSTEIKLAFLGFNAATAGVMFRSMAQYVHQHAKNVPTITIVCCSALIFWYFRTSSSIVFCLVAGAIFSLYMQIQQTKTQMSQRSKSLFHHIENNWFLGKNSIYIFILFFAVLWVISNYFPEEWYAYTYYFYFCGSLVIGPAASTFAFLYSFFTEMNLLEETQIWFGFPLAFLLPGSVINGALYYGVLIDGIRGLLVSAIFLYLPCFASLYGILPQWKYYRSKPGVQRLTKGLTCVTTGFLLAIIVLTLEHCAKVDVSSTFTIFILSIFFNYVWGYYSFIIILMGGLLANVRRWGLIYYRLLPDHPY